MLDEIRRRIDDAGNEDLVVGDFYRLEVLPFVVVARIGGLDADRLHARLEGDVDDLGHRQIVGVRPLVIAPADVQPHAVGRQPLGRGVERRDIALGDFFAEFVIAEMAVLVVARRAEIGRVDLQHEAGLDDGAVFDLSTSASAAT